MTKYYIHNNGQQLGPFSLDEVKQHGITRDTKVWYEGLPAWVAASEVESLATVFATPPPLEFATVNTGAVPPSYQEPVYYQPPSAPEYTEQRIWGMKPVHFRVVAGVVVLFIGFLFYNAYNRHTGIEVQEQVTNAEQGQQLQQQQAQLDQQNAAIAEQQRIEAERLAKKKEIEKQQHINELMRNYDGAVKGRYNAIVKLNEVSAFKVLRSASERTRQINDAQEWVDKWTQKRQGIINELASLGVEITNEPE